MNQEEHWSLELEAAYVMAKARDEAWLETFGLDRMYRSGTPGLPWLVKEHLARENPAVEEWKLIAAELENRVTALSRIATGLGLAWAFTLVLLLRELAH